MGHSNDWRRSAGHARGILVPRQLTARPENQPPGRPAVLVAMIGTSYKSRLLPPTGAHPSSAVTRLTT